MCAGSPTRVDSGELFDPDQDELIVALAHRELDPIAGFRADWIQERRARGDRHEIHGVHAERRDGIMANEQHVGSGAGDDRPSNLVRCGADDRPPDARSERHEQRDEKEDG